MRGRALAAMCALLALAGCTSSTSGPSVTASAPTTASSPASTESSSTGAKSAATGSALSPTAADWPMYHGRLDHAGVSTDMPAATGAPRLVHNLKLDGAVYASPIVVGGVTVVATENDSVYAFDSSYRQLWKVRLGSPSAAQERPCGNIDPLGITSTPISQGGRVFVVAEHGGSVRHEMVALDLKSGTVDWRRGIDLPGADPTVMQQRGALTITGGRVWASFGALSGDCGDYEGRVVGVPVAGTGTLAQYDPSTRKQGGIWNPAGPTVDAAGHLLVVSANGSSFPGDAYDHTNSVDEITAKGALVDSFAPKDWAQNNQGDVGLGSQGVALVGTKWAVLGGKSGPVYVLRQDHLGGIDGQVSVQNICRSFGGAAVTGDIVYLPCTDGVRAVRVDDAGTLHVLWHAAPPGSPVIGGGRVWTLDPSAGTLYGLDPATGKTLEQLDVGETSRFATPALSGRLVLVPTLTGLAVVQTS